MSHEEITQLLFIVFLFSCTSIAHAEDSATGFEGGDGTADNPYKIINVEQINLIRNKPNAVRAQLI